MNQVTLLGRIGQTPELRSTTSGAQVVEFSLATSRKYKDKNGEYQQDTQWHRITAWRGRAEAIVKHFGKGDTIIINGELRYDQWEDKEGNKRTTAKINVNEFFFGQKRKSGAQEPPANNTYTGKDMSDAMGGTPTPPAPVDEAPAF